jgi:undecaprenyl-diphosphatase
VEFSFLLAVPTMLGATGLDLLKNFSQFSVDQVQFLAIGFVVSFFAALAGVKYLLSYIKKHTFIPFGIYRIILVVVFWYIMYAT